MGDIVATFRVAKITANFNVPPASVVSYLLGTVDYKPRDDRFGITGSADTTKLLRFEVDGLTTGATRTVAVPDASGTMVLSGIGQTVSLGDITVRSITVTPGPFGGIGGVPSINQPAPTAPRNTYVNSLFRN